MKTLLIEAGHGGMSPDGNYMTNEKDGKYFVHNEDFTAYEGVTNRQIAARLIDKLRAAGIPCIQIHHDYLDVPYLSLITDAVNKHAREKDCFHLSIHSDAIASKTYPTPGEKKAFGATVFTSVGQTAADPFAEIIATDLEAALKPTGWPLRKDIISDGDKDREANFYVLKHTVCPSVLVELLYFDEINQALFLNSEKGQNLLAESLFQSIKKICGV